MPLIGLIITQVIRNISHTKYVCLVSDIVFHVAVLLPVVDGGPRGVVSTAAFHARVRGSFPGLGGLKETKMFLPHPLVKLSIVGNLRDGEVACSASDLQGLHFKSCVWRAVSSHSSHHPHEVLLAQFSLYVHKRGLKPDSFHFYLSLCHQNWRNYAMWRYLHMLTRKVALHVFCNFVIG